ncbi:M48 family metallopeptidase [Algicola sagamiensis]|uniref:M48 family metallopeptidase n=1 Tax=Algicola sagamiensis TaxID=163869 RepID=UPI00037049E4|nr:M48 family metallopeptidase [Algicola sagamiensis]
MQVFKKPLITISIVISLCLLAACQRSPTGRSQLLLFSKEKMAKMGEQSFTQLKDAEKKEGKISTDKKLNARVQCISSNIIRQLETDNNPKDWEVVVFDSDQLNAFALPGGKIGVYTGILKAAKNNDQLAAVIGHEVGHVLAQHGNARVSNNVAIQLGLSAADVLISSSEASSYRGELMAALGLGAQYGVALPYSRSHESEADIIGLELMHKAGFNVEDAPKLWQNMAALSKGSPPEFLSTHPNPKTRQRDLAKHGEYIQDTVVKGRRPNC